jgi:adenosylcobinamide-GDP ribazoletransferase
MQSEFSSLTDEARRAILFFTRLPVAWLGMPEPQADGSADGTPGMGQAIRMAPLAGLVVGAAGALGLVIGAGLTDSVLVGAVLALVATVLISGALHEDALADFADALGGTDPARRLEIMRDSRVGSYGVVALCLSLLARVALIAAIAGAGGMVAAATALMSAHALSRAFGLWLPYSLPPARKSGAAVAFGRPDERILQQTVLIGLIIALVLAASGAGLIATLAAIVLSGATAFAMGNIAERLFGGQTGDLSGTAIQLCEIAFLFAIAALI